MMLFAGLMLVGLVLWTAGAAAGAEYRHLLSPAGIAVMAILCLGVSALVVSALALVLPGAEDAAEGAGLAVILLALVAILAPGLRLPVWMWIASVPFLAVAGSWLIYGPLWRRFAGDGRSVRFVIRSGESPEAIWWRLYPDPDHAAEYHGALRIERHAALPDGVLVVSAMPGATGGEVSEAVLCEDVEPLRFARLRILVVGGIMEWASAYRAGDLLETQEMRLIPEAGGTRVEVVVTPHNLDPGARLAGWLGGGPGRVRENFENLVAGASDDTGVAPEDRPERAGI